MHSVKVVRAVATKYLGILQQHMIPSPDQLFFTRIKFLISCGLASLSLSTGVGADLLCHIGGFVYPLYQSYKALSLKSDECAHRRWLAYWVLFGIQHMYAEKLLKRVLPWIPAYHWLKAFFILWAIHPRSEGAEWFYQRVLQKVVSPYEVRVDAEISAISAHSQEVVDTVSGRVRTIIADGVTMVTKDKSHRGDDVAGPDSEQQ